MHDRRRRGRPTARSRSWSCPGRRPIVQRRNQILDLLATRSDPDVGRPVHRRRVHAPRRTRTSCSAARPRRAGSRRTSCGRSATSSPTSCAASARRPATRSSTAGCGSPRRSTSSLQKIAEKWVRAAAIVPHAKDPTAAAKALGFKKLEPWMANLQQQGPAQRRARRARLPDRRARRLRRQRELLRDLDQARVPAAVRRRRQGLPPARLGVQAVQLRDRHRRPARSPPARC